MKLKCPFCQEYVDSRFGATCVICKNCHDTMNAPFFRYYFENDQFIEYQLNINIDNKIYFLDSIEYEDNNLRFKQSTIISHFDHLNTKVIFRNNEYTPLPENKESIIKIVQRIINLKAFI